MEDNNITLKFQQTLEDLYQMQLIHLRKNNAMWIPIILGVLIFGYFPMLLNIEYNWIVVFVIVMLVLYLLVFPYYLKKINRKQFESNKMGQLIQNYNFNPDFVEAGNSLSTSRFEWHELYAKEETKEHFFLFISKIEAFILPKREFKDNAQMELLRQYISGLPSYRKASKASKPPVRRSTKLLWFAVILIIIVMVLFMRVLVSMVQSGKLA